MQPGTWTVGTIKITSEQPPSTRTDVAEILTEVARTLDAESGLEEMLRAVTASSVDTIRGADYAGITLVKNANEVESLAATDDLVVRADKAQEEFQEGPCLDALWEHDTVRVEDLEREDRWTNYRARALELGIRSSLSFQLFTEARNLGALNLYSKETHAFDDEAQHVGQMFAAHAAIALRGAQKESELEKALSNRDTIGMAKGILLERYKVTPDQAFMMLVRTSQNGHVKLYQVAEFLVRSGTERPDS